jgi:hypothetical protein
MNPIFFIQKIIWYITFELGFINNTSNEQNEKGARMKNLLFRGHTLLLFVNVFPP